MDHEHTATGCYPVVVRIPRSLSSPPSPTPVTHRIALVIALETAVEVVWRNMDKEARAAFHAWSCERNQAPQYAAVAHEFVTRVRRLVGESKVPDIIRATATLPPPNGEPPMTALGEPTQLLEILDAR